MSPSQVLKPGMRGPHGIEANAGRSCPHWPLFSPGIASEPPRSSCRRREFICLLFGWRVCCCSVFLVLFWGVLG